MISWRLYFFLSLMFTVGTAMALTMEGAYLGPSEANLVEELLGFNVAKMSVGQLILGAPIWGTKALSSALPKLLLWDYSFLEGELSAIKYFLLYPLSVAVVVALIMMTYSIAQGIFRFWLR